MPLMTRDPLELGVEQARARTSSYIYGNIIVLTVTVGATAHEVADGRAALVVLATAVTTFLAHVLAHVVGHAIGQDPEADQRESVRQILRDAVPIMTSGAVPVVLLLVGWAGWLPAEWTQVAASAVLIARIALVGLIIQRLSGKAATRAAFWSGIGIAVAAAVIVALKVLFAH